MPQGSPQLSDPTAADAPDAAPFGTVGSTPRSMLAGVIVGFDAIARAVAMAAFVFAGALAADAPLGLVIFLLANALGTGVLLAGRRLPVPIFSSVQIAPVAMLAPAIALVAETAGAAGVLVLLGSTAILSGLAMIAIARLSLARIVRMMPYPVAAGFLASSGALLVVAALDLAVADIGLAALDPRRSEALMPLLTLGFAGLLMAGAWFRNTLGVALVLLAGIIGTQIALPFLDPRTVAGLGLFHEAGSAPVGATLRDVGALGALPLPVVVTEILPVVLIAAMVGVLGGLLNASGAELVLNADIPNDAMLNRVGLANILCGAGGATITYVSASNSATAQRLGASGAGPMLAVVALCLCAVPFAAELYLTVPKFVSGGLLLFSGLGIVNVWLLRQYGRIGTTDWLLILAMVTASLGFGIVPATGLGILAASLIFAVLYAQVPVIRSITDLTRQRSTIDRGPAQTAWIETHGASTAIVRLQGFLFFGTATRVGSHVRDLLASGAVTRVVLDFRQVSRADASAMAALRRLEMTAVGRGATLILADLNAETRRALLSGGLVFGPDRPLRIAETLDAALEAVEEEILATQDAADRDETALSALTRQLGSEAEAEALLRLMTRQSVAQGTRLIRQGDAAGDVFVVDSGRLSVRLTLPGGRVRRLRTMAAGSLVGEVACYAGLDRTADVVADTPAVVYRADRDLSLRLVGSDPALAAALHRLVATTLAEKLDRTNKLLGSDT